MRHPGALFSNVVVAGYEAVTGYELISEVRPTAPTPYFTDMCSGSEAGSYLRRIDACITQLQAQGPARTCNESREEEVVCSSALPAIFLAKVNPHRNCPL